MEGQKNAAKSFRDLIVWQKAHRFTLAVYKYTGAFPKHETYGLASQMRRAALSIPANIAEGFGKMGRGEKARFMNIAEGSLEESRYYLILSEDLGYGPTQQLSQSLDEISRMLGTYARAIRSSIT